ncbi:MAG TPA: penicillin-binding protein [Holosporales bacterium]|nr:penicillin-binding protein [Holosporales bacterium]HBW24512.1 penicillin-binding protein [Holosporales bacterium]HCE95625.1 penicillin-binding protein [Holosporales bacterium]
MICRLPMLRFLSWTLTLVFILAVMGALGTLSILYYFGRGLPDYEQLAQYEPPVVSRFYASDGRLFAEYATEKRVFVPIETIPKRVIHAFLAAEDKNFFEHPGFDIFGIVRAAFVNMSQMGTNKRLKGASTITQQVAKNLLLTNIANQASYERKIKEAILAFRIETILSKNRILEIYLNEIFLGAGSYGVASAALNYFNKSLDELTIAEAAFLAALPKAPTRYNPKTNYEMSKGRRDWVITRMYEDGTITLDEAVASKNSPIELNKPDSTQVIKADYFAEEVRRQLLAKYGESAVYKGGLTIRTTVDHRLQKISDWVLRRGLIAYDRRHGWRGAYMSLDPHEITKDSWKEKLDAIPTPPGLGQWQIALVLKISEKGATIGLKSGEEGTITFSELTWARKHVPLLTESEKKTEVFVGPPISHPQEVLKVGDVVFVEALSGKEKTYSLQQIPAVSGAFIAMDPHTGRVLAMSGGFSFEASPFNRVTQAHRQPGSAIKPFVYLTAMERGFSPATIVSDSPISIAMGYGLGIYNPKNVTSHYYGAVPLRIGLQKSLNMMTIRLVHQYVGMKPVAAMIEKFGVIDHVPMQIAMALGAGETTLLRLATAYAMLANGGKQLVPTLIDRVQDRYGKTLFAADSRICVNCNNVTWSNQPSPAIVDHRQQLADPRSIYQITSMLEGAVRAGSAQRAKVLEKILAAKTGTTNDEKDAWTFAYTPDLVVGTYVGFDNPHCLGHMEGGARVALPLIVEFLDKALKDVPNKPFKMPPGMKLVRMHEMTGRPAQGGGAGIIYEALKVNQDLRNYSEGSSYGEESYGEEPHTTEFREPGENFVSNSFPQNEPEISRPQESIPLTGTGGLY